MKAFLYVTQTQPPKGNFNVTSINCSSSSRTLVFLLILLLPYSTHLRSKNPASDQNAISLMQAHITMLRYPTRRAPPFTETPISIQCSFFGQNYARTAHYIKKRQWRQRRQHILQMIMVGRRNNRDEFFVFKQKTAYEIE